MNILITTVGRRNYLVEYFKSALEGVGKVIVSNSIADTSGMYTGDKSYVTPPIRNREYIPFLLDICKKENIDAVIPLLDMDLSAIAFHQELFLASKIFPVVSNYHTIDLCFDKSRYFPFLTGHDIKTPQTYFSIPEITEKLQEGAIQFPLILKPRWGTGSMLTEVASDEAELGCLYRLLSGKMRRAYLDTPVPEGHVNTMIIQEFVQGEEFGIDVVNDLKGAHVKSFVKRKLGMRSGETDAAITVHNPELERFGAKISAALRHLAILDVDLIATDDSELYLIDMNPRFGGGYPFTHQAGVNLPAVIVSWLRGESPDGRFLEMAEGITLVKGISLFRKPRG